MKSRKLFISCLPGDEKYATAPGKPITSIKGIKAQTSQEPYTAEDLESADMYLLIVTPRYLESLWMNFEMGVALARRRSAGTQVMAIVHDVDREKVPLLIRQVSSKPRARDDLFIDFPIFGSDRTTRK